MVINGKEVNFKVSNLKHAAAMNLALDEMGKTEKKIGAMKDKNLVNVLTAMISMFRQFFISATGVDVLEDCEDLDEANQAYHTFLAEIKKQKTAMLSAYSPDSIE